MRGGGLLREGFQRQVGDSEELAFLEERGAARGRCGAKGWRWQVPAVPGVAHTRRMRRSCPAVARVGGSGGVAHPAEAGLKEEPEKARGGAKWGLVWVDSPGRLHSKSSRGEGPCQASDGSGGTGKGAGEAPCWGGGCRLHSLDGA